MDSVRILIVECLYFMELINAHARQYHNLGYVKSIKSTLLPHKIIIYNAKY